MASIKDVAKKAGVSISTVSSLINRTKSVSRELTGRIEQAIEELNYQANPVARSLKSRKTNTIGVILPNISRLFFPQVLKGIEDTAIKNGYYLTFYDANESIEQEKQYVRMLENSWVDGIILDCSADVKEDGEYLEYLTRLGNKKKKIPVVSLERVLKDHVTDAVIIDNRQSGYLAVKHLIELGHKTIAHISGPLKFPMCVDRIKGYKSALQEHGIQFEEELMKNGDFTPLSGYYAMKELLMQGRSITAVFAANDQMAIGAIKAINEAGFKIPDDIAIIGFDNLFASTIITPSLSTINVPKYKMGSTAVEILIDRITNPDKKEKEVVTLPSNLIIRQSTSIRGDNTWDLYGW